MKFLTLLIIALISIISCRRSKSVNDECTLNRKIIENEITKISGEENVTISDQILANLKSNCSLAKYFVDLLRNDSPSDCIENATKIANFLCEGQTKCKRSITNAYELECNNKIPRKRLYIDN